MESSMLTNLSGLVWLPFQDVVLWPLVRLWDQIVSAGTQETTVITQNPETPSRQFLLSIQELSGNWDPQLTAMKSAISQEYLLSMKLLSVRISLMAGP